MPYRACRSCSTAASATSVRRRLRRNGTPMKDDLATAELNTQNPRRAVIYLRVSTNSQAETDFDAEGLSIKAQRHECVAKAKALNAVVVAEYVDIGESARSANRQQLQ